MCMCGAPHRTLDLHDGSRRVIRPGADEPLPTQCVAGAARLRLFRFSPKPVLRGPHEPRSDRRIIEDVEITPAIKPVSYRVLMGPIGAYAELCLVSHAGSYYCVVP